jgi:hypothetical protein
MACLRRDNLDILASTAMAIIPEMRMAIRNLFNIFRLKANLQLMLLLSSLIFYTEF